MFKALEESTSFIDIRKHYISVDIIGLNDEESNELHRRIGEKVNQLIINLGINNDNVNDAMIIACDLSSIELMDKIIKINHNISTNLMRYCKNPDTFDWIIKNIYHDLPDDKLQQLLVTELEKINDDIYIHTKMDIYTSVLNGIINNANPKTFANYIEGDEFNFGWTTSRLFDNCKYNDMACKFLSLCGLDTDMNHNLLKIAINNACDADNIDIFDWISNKYNISINGEQFTQDILHSYTGNKIFDKLMQNKSFQDQFNNSVRQNWQDIAYMAIDHTSVHRYIASTRVFDLLLNMNLINKKLLLSSDDYGPIFKNMCHRSGMLGMHVAKKMNISKNDIDKCGIKLDVMIDKPYSPCSGEMFLNDKSRQDAIKQAEVDNEGAYWLRDNLGARLYIGC